MNFRILTYNIHRAIGVDRRFRLERIIKILSHYDAHIVLLQEVDEGVPRSRRLDLAFELANALHYPHLAAGQNVKLRKGGYGNATLSRYPILSKRNIDLTVGRRKRRGCLYTKIQLHDTNQHSFKIDVFNLHLGLLLAERVQQIGILTRSNEFKSLDKNHVCLLGGDFNDWRNVLVPIFLDILGFNSAGDKKGIHGHSLNSYPSFSPRGALDKIYCRGNIKIIAAHRCRMLLSKIASDHLPIIMDLEL